jgi:hypothetical protein
VETATAADQAQLSEIASRLREEQQGLSALDLLNAGTAIARPSPELGSAIDVMMQRIGPLLTGARSSSEVGAALQAARALLGVAQNAGLPGALADGIAVLQGVADFAGPVIGGIPGGPAGIVAGIVLGGVALFKDQQKFSALKSALLKAPFDPTLMPTEPDANTALAALQASPLLSTNQAIAQDPQAALIIMQAALEKDADGALLPAETVAAGLLQSGSVKGLAEQFRSAEQLVLALDEYRRGLVFDAARKRLTGNVVLPLRTRTPPAFQPATFSSDAQA